MHFVDNDTFEGQEDKLFKIKTIFKAIDEHIIPSKVKL